MALSWLSLLLQLGLLTLCQVARGAGSKPLLGPYRYTNSSTTLRSSHITITATPTTTRTEGNWTTIVPWSTPLTIIAPMTNGTGPEYATSCNAAQLSYSGAVAQGRRPKVSPTCYIDDNDCIHLKRAQDASWSMNNILTISLASPPNSIVVNGQTTKLDTSGPLTTPPPLTLNGQVYTTLPYAHGVSYTISNATNLMKDLILTPGGQVTATYDGDYPFHDADLTMPYRSGGPACTRLFTNGFRWILDHGELSIGQLPTRITQNSEQASQCKTQRPCTITGVSVDLQFFAPPLITRDLNENTSPGWYKGNVPTYSHPHESTVINSTTYWSDSAYLKYDSIYAVRTCDEGATLVGAVVTDHVIALKSSEVSSLCGWQRYRPVNNYYTFTVGATPWPVNFYDFQGSVPESAWNCQPPPILLDKPYAPKLAVPTEIRTLNPDWESCVMWFQGSFDPPTALGTASILATLTSAAVMTSLPATPGVTPPPLLGTTAPIVPTHPALVVPTLPSPDPTPITAIGSGLVLPDPSNPANVIITTPTPSNFPNAPQQVPGEVLSPGGPPKVIDGTTVSVAPGGNVVIVAPGDASPKTIRIPAPAQLVPDPLVTAFQSKVPVAVVGDQIVYKDPSKPSEVIMVGEDGSATTMTSGSQPMTISGTVLRLSPAPTQGMDLVIQAPNHPPTTLNMHSTPEPDPEESTIVQVATLGSTTVTFDMSQQASGAITLTFTTPSGEQKTVSVSLPLLQSSTLTELADLGITVVATSYGIFITDTKTGMTTSIPSAVLEMLSSSIISSSVEHNPGSSELTQATPTGTRINALTTTTGGLGDGSASTSTQSEQGAERSSDPFCGMATDIERLPIYYTIAIMAWTLALLAT